MSQPKDHHEKTESFKVVDHRHFNPDGTEKTAEAASAPSSQQTPPSASKESETSAEPAQIPYGGPSEMSFANLILSLAGSAQMQLGLSPNPFTQKIEKDLNQARQTIDLLALLAQKTKGNLSPEEDQLLQVILSDLRLRFVEEKK